jgi:hypothetical protein
MGPVSAFGFSVCGWVRFEALGWRGRGGDRPRHPGRCAGHQQQGDRPGKQSKGMGTGQHDKGHTPSPLPTYLSHRALAWAAWQAWSWATLPGRQGTG